MQTDRHSNEAMNEEFEVEIVCFELNTIHCLRLFTLAMGALKPFVYSNFSIFIAKATHMQLHGLKGRHLLSLHLASPLKITMQRTQKLRFQMNEFRLHN